MDTICAKFPCSRARISLRRILDPGREFRFSDHQLEKGKELFELARQQDLEGIVGKRVDSFYAGARSPSWVKLKATKTLDAVVGGWTAPRGSRTHFGSLLLGLYQGKALRFVGHAGTGMDEKMRDSLMKKLRELEIDKCPFDKIPETNEQAFWAKPELVAHVRFIGWTQEPRLRAPVFLALRNDVRPEECRWENEVAPQAAPAHCSLARNCGHGLKQKGRDRGGAFFRKAGVGYVSISKESVSG